MIQEYKDAFAEIAKLAPAERSPYQTWVVVTLIRDLAGLIITAIVVWALGRRMIHAIVSALLGSPAVDVLEVMFIVELVILGLAGILMLVGTMIARQNPDDPIYIFISTFWREFLWPPQDMRLAAGAARGKPTGPARQVADDDETYGRIMKNAEGTIDKCELMVLLEPHAPTDEVVGRDGDGLRIRVAGEPAESRTNKALIEMVATAVGVKPYQVTLTKGHYQTRKTVQIQGMTHDEVQAKLELMNEA